MAVKSPDSKGLRCRERRTLHTCGRSIRLEGSNQRFMAVKGDGSTRGTRLPAANLRRPTHRPRERPPTEAIHCCGSHLQVAILFPVGRALLPAILCHCEEAARPTRQSRRARPDCFPHVVAALLLGAGSAPLLAVTARPPFAAPHRRGSRRRRRILGPLALVGWTRGGKERRLRMFGEGSSPHAGGDRLER